MVPNSEHAARHDAVRDIAREAGALALRYFEARADLAIEAKASPQDVVSIADREVETLIATRIAALFPEDGLLGEEHAPVPTKSGYTWIIDPIDGTSPFVMGMPDWCVSIAVHDGTRPVASAICAPRVDDLYHGVRGGGAWLNGQPLAVDRERTIQSGLLGMGANYRIPRTYITTFADRLLEAGGMFYRNGSGALMIAYVAAGRLVGYFEPHINAWDCMAAILLVEEAGGWVAPFCADGDLARGDAIIAAAPGARDALLRLSDGLIYRP
ncbi:inositol monophosphatase family protein [Pelagibacterium lacus]|uniref:Inositol-1-monophosphatase n=1 Tax=Pelagibacterium lacus TaxID=2282655 RepID=A0A369W4S6_9HYPH|nr:inositol monophosphatase [Pelagibacterium lacus]RDE08350.1 inositol monophosphatase [Pelagibacterium lacus]